MAHLEIEAREIVRQAVSLPGGYCGRDHPSDWEHNGCTPTLTFNKKFARLDCVELLV